MFSPDLGQQLFQAWNDVLISHAAQTIIHPNLRAALPGISASTRAQSRLGELHVSLSQSKSENYIEDTIYVATITNDKTLLKLARIKGPEAAQELEEYKKFPETPLRQKLLDYSFLTESDGSIIKFNLYNSDGTNAMDPQQVLFYIRDMKHFLLPPQEESIFLRPRLTLGEFDLTQYEDNIYSFFTGLLNER